jgi:uncharacterized membrane protein YkoI
LKSVLTIITFLVALPFDCLLGAQADEKTQAPLTEAVVPGFALAEKQTESAATVVEADDQISEAEFNKPERTAQRNSPLQNNPPSPRGGETIWVEEKMRPTTQWMEDLVSPLTTWMERKIHDRNPSSAESETTVWIRKTKPGTPTAEFTDPLISPNEASLTAQQHMEGEVLRVKLLFRGDPQYRVKLISKKGEIHLLYVNATTGKLIRPLEDSSER